MQEGQCPEVSSSGKTCYYISGHPGRVHVDLSTGWPHSWMAANSHWSNQDHTGDALRDAPEALAKQVKQAGSIRTFSGHIIAGEQGKP